MRKSRYTEEQIRLAVQQAEAGVDVTERTEEPGSEHGTPATPNEGTGAGSSALRLPDVGLLHCFIM